MKKKSRLIALCMILVMLMTMSTYALNIDAKSAILIDADSGAVLFEKDADAKRAPASMTKMMTAILTVENLDLDEKVEVSKHVTAIGESAIGLKKGEKIKVRDLLGVMMVYSANDCAVCLGEAISGSEEEFAKLMTKRAKEIGCTNTVFKNASGLDQKGHVSTARDMAIIARKAVSYEEIAKIVCMTTYQMEKTNKRVAVTVGSTDRLLFDTYSYIKVDGKSRHPYYKYACGIKTGYTDKAGGCLASLAVKNGKRLISVVMKSTDMKRFSGAIKVLDYGFDNYVKKTIAKEGESFGEIKVLWGKESKIDAVAEKDYTVLDAKGEDNVSVETILDDSVKAPVEKGQIVGKIKVYYKGDEIDSANLVSAEAVDLSFLGEIMEHKVAVTAILIVLLVAILVIRKRREE